MNEPEYIEGQNAFKSGKTDDDCPYESSNDIKKMSDQRLFWMRGFHDEKTSHWLKERGYE